MVPAFAGKFKTRLVSIAVETKQLYPLKLFSEDIFKGNPSLVLLKLNYFFEYKMI